MERIAPFVLERPASLAEAVALLAATPGARPLAGGTDLLPNLRDGIGESPVLVDLGGIGGFSAITVERERTTIGAGVTLARIASDATIAGALPALAEAAATVAGPGHRTVATLGGNLCLDTRCVFYNQSEWWRRANDFCLKHGGDVCHVAPQGKRCHAAFSGDLAPVLLVLDADGRDRRPGRRAAIAARGALSSRTARGTCRSRPAKSSPRCASRSSRRARARGYRKARARGAIDFPLAGVAAQVAMNDGRLGALRVALTGTNARPFLLDGTHALIGAAVTDETLDAARQARAEAGESDAHDGHAFLLPAAGRGRARAAAGARACRRTGCRRSRNVRLKPHGRAADRHGHLRQCSGSGSPGSPARRWTAADGIHVDVRGLAPPEPFLAIVRAARVDRRRRDTGDRPSRARPGAALRRARRARLDRGARRPATRVKCG